MKSFGVGVGVWGTKKSEKPNSVLLIYLYIDTKIRTRDKSHSNPKLQSDGIGMTKYLRYSIRNSCENVFRNSDSH